MGEPLNTYWRRYANDPPVFSQSVGTPVLIFEIPDSEPLRTLITYQLHTIPKSGYQLPFLGPGAHVEPVRRANRDSADARVRVGRTPDNDVIIDHASISRLHAWFEWDPHRGEWLITDAGSRNGTVVNARRLSARKGQPLGSLATIGFGTVNAQFFAPEALIRFLSEYSGQSDG